jgi:excisionase family DNA binding protein
MATWLTVKQVAEYLQLSTSTIYSMTKEGILPASRIRNQWRFDKIEIDHWVKNNSTNQARRKSKQ